MHISCRNPTILIAQSDLTSIKISNHNRDGVFKSSPTQEKHIVFKMKKGMTNCAGSFCAHTFLLLNLI